MVLFLGLFLLITLVSHYALEIAYILTIHRGLEMKIF